MSLSTRNNYTSSTTASIPTRIKTNNISFRFAGVQDIENISTLAIETYKQTYSAALPYYTDEVLEQLFGQSFRENVLSKEINDARYQYIICEDNGKMIGYSKLEFKKDSAYLDKLYLLNEYQGKGYGQSLMQACFQSAIAHKFTTMTLNVWPENKKAINFYSKNGFQSGKVSEFFLFGKIPTGQSDMEMTCEDIRPYITCS